MKNENNKYISVKMDKELHYKFQYLAKHEGRSGNAQMLHLILKCIEEFKEEHGEIKAKD